MHHDRKAKPLGVCSVCHALTNLHEDLNHRCNHVVTGRRCAGTYKSAMAFLWDGCETCDATGVIGSEPCSECAGFGWKMYG